MINRDLLQRWEYIMKKIVAIIIAIIIAMASCCLIKTEVSAEQDKHDWEWVDGYTNNCEAYDESGKIIKHL